MVSVVVAGVGSGVGMEPGLAEGDKTDTVMKSRAGGATYRVQNKDAKSAYVAECGTPRRIKRDRKAHARRIQQCSVFIKISVE